MIIAIDTATRLLSIALFDGTTILSEQTWVAGNQHNSLLSPSIAQTLEICGISPKNITAVAVAHGPGSYTGLRIGVSFAKGMASARALPLVGVSTLDILALGQPVNPKQTLIALLQAGKGRVIVGKYSAKKARWHADQDPFITDWETALTIDGATLVTGEIEAEAQALISAKIALGSPFMVASPASRVRRASLLAEEAHRRLLADKDGDFSPAKLFPIYVSSPV